eukprot:gb/GECG01012793.1/.p1 GENE.gb/GECG01012793.1/~~gb/GECG01012793.1/.p1  ORF type:complete len:257 (+),score=35.88 gb/GECG01012793.1/:1-771(+)
MASEYEKSADSVVNHEIDDWSGRSTVRDVANSLLEMKRMTNEEGGKQIKGFRSRKRVLEELITCLAHEDVVGLSETLEDETTITIHEMHKKARQNIHGMDVDWLKDNPILFYMCLPKTFDEEYLCSHVHSKYSDILRKTLALPLNKVEDNVDLTGDDGFGMLAFTMSPPIIQLRKHSPCYEIELDARGSLQVFSPDGTTDLHRTVGESKFTARKKEVWENTERNLRIMTVAAAILYSKLRRFYRKAICFLPLLWTG